MIQEVRPYDFGLPLDAAILGALLTEGTLPDHLRPLLQVERFAHPYRMMARAVKEALDVAGICDLAATQERLMRLGGGAEDCGRLRELMEQVPSAAHLEQHLKLLSERGGDGAGQPDQPDPLLVGSGLTALGENAPLTAVEAALRALAAGLDGTDPLRRGVLREAAVRCLERAGVKSPASLVDAALGPRRQEGPGESQGQGMVLSDPTPWSEPVDGVALLGELAAAFSRFVILPEGGADAASLWTLHTYTLDAATVSPFLTMMSPERRCGKTRLLEVLSAVARRPIFASNLTPPVLYRGVEKYQPTLLADEFDALAKEGHEELKGILNAGHSRSTAFVLRCVGDEHEPKLFSTWAPKAVALIGKLPPTLEDRSILIPMRRRAPGELVERLRMDRLAAEVEPLRRRATRWAKDHLEELRAADPEMPEALHDREQDNWRPLVAIADAAGGEWPKRGRRAALLLSGAADVEDESIGVLLLADLREVFGATQADRLPTAEILKALEAMEERPWATWGKARKPINAHAMAWLLRPFGVRSHRLKEKDPVTQGWVDRLGYSTGGKMADAWERYLTAAPPSGGFQSPPNPPSQENQGLSQESKAPHGGAWGDSDSSATARNERNGGLGGVQDPWDECPEGKDLPL